MTRRLRPCTMKVMRLIVLMCLGGLLPTAVVGQTLVWTDVNARRIQRKDVNGAEVSTIAQFQSPQAAYQIHYDPITAKLYYSLVGTTGSFERAKLDGSQPENIPTPSWGIFALNVELRKLYWINPLDVINRSELDGTGVESHTYPTCCLLTVEAVGDDVFFGAGGEMLKGIWRADADGSNEQFLHSTPQPIDIAHDPIENMLYVATVTKIVRLNTDGAVFQEIILTRADQIVVDSLGRKVYWGRGSVLRRSNLDGSNVEDFVTAADVGNPNLDIQGLTIVYPDCDANGVPDYEDIATGASDDCNGNGIPDGCEADCDLDGIPNDCDDPCPPATGACCDHDPFYVCADGLTLAECLCERCEWTQDAACRDVQCRRNAIPTLGVWGLAVLTLLLLIAAKLAFGRPVALSRVTHGG